jgi:hypothetical protein
MSHFEAVEIKDASGNVMTLEDNGSLPVTLQDQVTPAIIAPLRKELGVDVLTADMVIDELVISVGNATGRVQGEVVLLRDVTNNRFSFFEIVSINVNDITVDRPIDFAYTVANSTVSYATDNLAVNGSVTPEVFSLRNSANPQIPTTADITRIIITMITNTGCTLPDFGDLGKLTNGITLRHTDGEIRNLFNVKNNQEMAGIAYDLTFYTAAGQGQDGLACRMTFAGQNKIGVAIRLNTDEDLQLYIGDDLSGLIDFRVIAEGHIVT